MSSFINDARSSHPEDKELKGIHYGLLIYESISEMRKKQDDAKTQMEASVDYLLKSPY